MIVAVTFQLCPVFANNETCVDSCSALGLFVDVNKNCATSCPSTHHIVSGERLCGGCAGHEVVVNKSVCAAPCAKGHLNSTTLQCQELCEAYSDDLTTCIYCQMALQFTDLRHRCVTSCPEEYHMERNQNVTQSEIVCVRDSLGTGWRAGYLTIMATCMGVLVWMGVKIAREKEKTADGEALLVGAM